MDPCLSVKTLPSEAWYMKNQTVEMEQFIEPLH